jgi:hypothetical protein
MQRCVSKEVCGIHINTPWLQIVTSGVRTSTASPMQRRRSFFVLRSYRQSKWFEICQTICLITLCRNMQHVDSFTCLYFVISLVSHQEFDKLDVTMETCIVQGIETLFRIRRCIDPTAHFLAHFALKLVNLVWVQWIRMALAAESRVVDLFEMLG